MVAILPIAVVTVAEHIGDHTVLSQICGRQFLKNPGLSRTLIGDGVATAVSALIGVLPIRLMEKIQGLSV